MILRGKNRSFKKGQKMDIFHGFCPKIELSLIASFHRNYDHYFVQKSKFLLSLFFIETMSEKILFGYLNRKQSLKDQKTKLKQWPKNGHFLKG